jgi:tetratricopeptide (TPR) repeat protein
MAMTIPAGRSRIYMLVIVIAVTCLVCVTLGLTGYATRPSATSTQLRAIEAEVAKLVVKPRRFELTSEKALRVRNAIKQGDYATARRIVADVLANSHLQNWRFYPFSDFIGGIVNVNDTLLEAHLNAWVAQDGNDAIPLLIRAQYYCDTGWFERGGNFIREIQASHLASFGRYMAKAYADVDAALKADNSVPYGFYLKLRIVQAAGTQPQMKSAFDTAIAKFPGYYPLYNIMLTTLEPKWGGTVAAMYAFVERHAGRAPEQSPLKLLYVTLYRDLLNIASGACYPNWRDQDRMAQCVGSAMQKIATPQLEHQVAAALQLYDHTDKYQFGVAVQGLLLDMLKTAGAEAYSGGILQLAASSMHTDTQLAEDKPGDTNYVIDNAVSQSWYMKGFYDNAMQKDREALTAVEATTFPNEEEKALAQADIYQNIAGTYNKGGQYPSMIAYEKAAIALGGRTEFEYLICYGFYRLRNYDEAVRSCSKMIEGDAGNLQARYWRGAAYRDSGRKDAALADFTAVAEAEGSLRASAAIDLSMIHFNAKDVRGALDVLNKYTYLYDPNLVTKSDVAVGYNNRCYAYMQLGELKKALDDCTASLKYGSIPDAFRKQQELLRRIGAHEISG